MLLSPKTVQFLIASTCALTFAMPVFRAEASTIEYNVNWNYGPVTYLSNPETGAYKSENYTVLGKIVTDGTLGDLSASNILSWSLSMGVSAYRIIINSGGNSGIPTLSINQVSNNPVLGATKNELLFVGAPYPNGESITSFDSGSYLFFSNTSISGAWHSFGFYDSGGYSISNADTSMLPFELFDDPLVRIEPNYVLPYRDLPAVAIGTVTPAPVPLPGGLPMMSFALMALTCSRFHLRKRNEANIR